MNTTVLRLNAVPCASDTISVPSLRRWLGGRWALFFSHPDDFATYGFETDRWLEYVRDAFIANDLRALGPADTAQESCASWTAKIGDVAPRSCMDELRRMLSREHSLMTSSEGRQPDAWRRFVLLLDDAAQVRWSLRYRSEERLPSPIELASFAKAKRMQPIASKRPMQAQPRVQLRIVPTARSWRTGERPQHDTCR